MAAHAQALNDRAEAEKVLGTVPLKHSDAPSLQMKMPSPDEIRLFHVTPAPGRARPDHRRSQFDPLRSFHLSASGHLQRIAA
jgi:hypothetical protein